MDTPDMSSCPVSQTSSDSRIVDTVYGKMSGRRLSVQGDKQVDAFQGIPFAAPPVGELRFKKPVPPQKWENVILLTRAFAPRCIQAPKSPVDYQMNGVPSEDSLYLNVFTPCWEAPERGFPVMVFIHGGGFVNGEASAYGDVNICENVVTRGVVFVTIQYRLGYLGFFSTGDSACPGNLGLWDQVAALRWVQENIGAFGGDKDNVTLLGQSAGAASVDLLHLSPHSTNLFHKAILMAGAAECRWANNTKMVQSSARKATSLGVEKTGSSEEWLDELRKLPADQFGVGMFTQTTDDCDFETGPCMDGDFFPASFDELRAKATPKPFLTGITQEEGLLMMAPRQPTAEGLEQALQCAVYGIDRKQEMIAELRQRFIGDARPEDGPLFTRPMVQLLSDAMIDVGVLEHCRKTVTIQDQPVFLYLFEHHNPAIMGFLESAMFYPAATHTCELFYLFKKGIFADPELTDVEKHVMNIYTTACTNFAKHGDPNGASSTSDLPVRWDPITREKPFLNYVITSKDPLMKDGMFEGRTLEFLEILNKYKEPL